jgi:hypothetical protein
MSGSYRQVSPAGSEHRDQISTAGPEYYLLGDISKTSDSKVSSTQMGQEAIAIDLPVSGFHHESETVIPRPDRSHTNPHQDHPNAQRDQYNPRRQDDALEDLEIHLPVLNDKELRSLDKEWHPSTQLRKLLFKGLLKWLATAIFVIVIYGVLFAFSRKPVMDDRNKKVGNPPLTTCGQLLT